MSTKQNLSADRDPKGRFEKGTIPNPTGRPVSEVNQLARKLTERDLLQSVWNDAEKARTIQRLVAISQNGSDREAIAAAKLLLDRMFGTPTQTVRFEAIRSNYQLVLPGTPEAEAIAGAAMLALPAPDEDEDSEGIDIPVWSAEAYLNAYESKHEPDEQAD